MNKKSVIFIITFILVILLLIFSILYFNYDIEVHSIKQLNFNSDTNELTIEITKKWDIFNRNFTCSIYNEEVKITEEGKDNKCTLTFLIGSDYNLILESNNKSYDYNILDYLDNTLEFKFKYETIYLSVGETKKIECEYKSINGNIDFYTNDNIISVNDDVITANESGTTKLYKDDSTYMNVIVTDLVTTPNIKKKTILPCNQYSEEQNIFLDKMLEFKVKEAGYGTRAGVVAAARFLTLQLPYRIPYFYENGRLNNTGVNIADGEGRYYHKGLYLNDFKKKDIIKSVSGPAIWGCPLYNWEDDPDYGFIWGTKMPNGLDCSGFVTWVLYNGGFDPGDNGAGNSETNDEVTDLGEFVPLTRELAMSDDLKAGDLVNYWGHIAIIVGIDDDNYYVAESLQNFGGVVVNTYKKEKINNTFSYAVLMDSYYKEDGNYTAYWE